MAVVSAGSQLHVSPALLLSFCTGTWPVHIGGALRWCETGPVSLTADQHQQVQNREGASLCLAQQIPRFAATPWEHSDSEHARESLLLDTTSRILS